MSYLKSKFKHPGLPKNDLGLTYREYEGSLSTLCAGCGHDSIGGAIIQACHELSLPPHRIAKMSGIGCSSKAPNYFLNNAHGFNSVHGRMPSVATGANMANRDLIYIGMSGDGDTSNIGFGQFAHVIRRQLNMMYVVANNGVYGLTKGQSSATAKFGSKSKSGVINSMEDIDLASIAIEMGATFVARSFSGDTKQLVALMKAAISHKGLALLDIISPCVTFNNHVGSAHSFDYFREYADNANMSDFVPFREEIISEVAAGKTKDINLHDGSVIRLRHTENEHDVLDRMSAQQALAKAKKENTILTGLLYVDPHADEMHDILGTTATPLNELGEKELCPGVGILDSINAGFR